VSRRFTAGVVAVVGLLLAVGLVLHLRPRPEPSRTVSASGSGSTGARPGRLGVVPTPPPSGVLRIQGVVLDDQGPVAGVRVSASRPEAGQTLSELPCPPPDEDVVPSDDAPWLLPACVDESTSLILELTGAREGEAPVYAEAVTGGDGTFVLEGLPPGSALLVVKRGPNAGSRFLLDKDMTTAGRHPESDIFLDDVTVSRRHAEFRRTGGGYEVRDVGSLNGTYLNRERIDATELAGGDEVQIGKFRLVYLTGPSADAGAAQ